MIESALQNQLTWAIPVQAEQLLASVEAYTTLSPTIRTLRRCHQSGSATVTAPITKLPVDVLLMIEDMLVEDDLQTYLLQWHRRLRCLRNGDPCWQTVESILSHFSDEEIADDPSQFWPANCECAGMELLRAGLKFQECQCQWGDMFECSDVLSTHESLRNEVRDAIQEGNLVPAELRTELCQRYKLDIWMSCHFNHTEATTDDSQGKIVCYLIPASSCQDMTSPSITGISKSDQHGSAARQEAAVSEALSQGQLIRELFDRALKSLRLVPDVTDLPSQAATTEIQDVQSNPAWPRLISLPRTNPSRQ